MRGQGQTIYRHLNKIFYERKYVEILIELKSTNFSSVSTKPLEISLPVCIYVFVCMSDMSVGSLKNTF